MKRGAFARYVRMMSRALSLNAFARGTKSPGKRDWSQIESSSTVVTKVSPTCCCRRRNAIGKSLERSGYANTHGEPSLGKVMCPNRKLRLAINNARKKVAVDCVMVESKNMNRSISRKTVSIVLSGGHTGFRGSFRSFTSLTSLVGGEGEAEDEEEEEEEEDE
jgi:hypothetical protein